MPVDSELPSDTRRRRRRWAHALLVMQMVIVGGVLLMGGKLHPLVIPDTRLYSEFPMQTLEAALKNHRTPAYPLLLRAVGLWSSDFIAVPSVHYLLYCLAVVVFYRGLAAVQAGEIRHALIAGTLLYSNLLHNHVYEIGADCVAAAGAIAVLGFTLQRVGGRTGWLTLLAIALTTFLTWLTRPAYLFLVVMVPLVCALGRLIISQPASASDAATEPSASGPSASEPYVSKPRWRSLLPVVAATLLPLIAYCTLQWFVVGRFAVVSLGGYNLIGISGQFLDEQNVEQLPPELQPLGRRALEKRRTLSGSDAALPDAHRLNYQRMETRYDGHIWRVFVPAAQELYGEDSHAVVNAHLKEMAVAIVVLRPTDYLTWLAKAFRRGMQKIATEFVLNPASLVILLMTIAALLVVAVRPVSRRDRPLSISLTTRLVFIIAVLFVAMKLPIVILVSIPIERMTAPMGMFLPVVCMALLVDLVVALSFRDLSFQSG